MKDVDNPGFLPAELMSGSVSDFGATSHGRSGHAGTFGGGPAQDLHLRYVATFERTLKASPRPALDCRRFLQNTRSVQCRARTTSSCCTQTDTPNAHLSCKVQGLVPMSRPWACLPTSFSCRHTMNESNSMKTCRVWAPATVANLNVGFDALGCALDALGIHGLSQG